MDQQDRDLLIEALNLNTSAIVEAIEDNTERVQELLERLECIDNSLDEMRDKDPILEAIRELQRQFLRRS